jgi:hypothetical protein
VQPRISVIIPSYNCLRYLPAALGSVRRQGITELEIIVIDDGSSDGSGEWLAAEVQRDPRVVALNTSSRRSGPAIARNVGIRAARAHILAFLDADDSWYPDAIADRLALHESDPSVVLSFADSRSVSLKGRDLGNYFPYCRHFYRWIGGRTGVLPLGERALAMIFAEAVCCTSTALAARDALLAMGGFQADLRFSQDWECWLRLAQRGAVWCSTRVATKYLVRPGSNSRNLQGVLAANRKIFDLYAPVVQAIEPRAVRIGRAGLNVVAAELAREEGRTFLALRSHLKALSVDPSARVVRSSAYDVAKLIGLR